MDARKIVSASRWVFIMVVVALVATPAWAQNEHQRPGHTGAPEAGSSTVQNSLIHRHSAEFKKFAKAYSKAREIEAHAIRRLHRIIRKSPLSERQIIEIQKSLNGKAARKSTTISSRERREYSKVTHRIDKVQRSVQEKLATAVKQEGLTVAQFYQMMRAVERNPKLMRHLEQE